MQRCGTIRSTRLCSNGPIRPASVSRLSGFTFLDSVGTADGFNGLINVLIADSGSGQPTIRIDDNLFSTTARRWLVTSNTRGLADHNTINCPGGAIFSMFNWNAAWLTATPFGTANQWYLENNTWNKTAATDTVDCQYGASYVARYNTVNYSGSENADCFFGHGYDSVYRGCKSIEAYNNTFNTSVSGGTNSAVLLRGGTGIVLNNTLNQTGGSYWGYGAGLGLALDYYRSTSDTYMTLYAGAVGYCSSSDSTNGQPCSNVTCTGTSYKQNCGYNGSGGQLSTGINPADSTAAGAYGYPCRDQIGRGGGCTNPPCNGTSFLPQPLVPVYEANNTQGGSPVHWTNTTYNPSYAPNLSIQVQANRDYYDAASGLAASIPATCTPLAGYWATDTNTLYQCKATNTWTAYYTPYTYPHPLRLRVNSAWTALRAVDCQIPYEPTERFKVLFYLFCV